MTSRSAFLVDSYGRTLRDLRVSVTDRCNFRCLYCLPETEEAANFYRAGALTRSHAVASPGSEYPTAPPVPGAVADPRDASGPTPPPRRHPHPTPPFAPVTIVREWKPRRELLTFEEIERVVRIFVGLGITKIRLTGGEPLLRSDLPDLVARIAAIPGVEDLAMTSNGFLFARYAQALAQSGLHRISFSLDSLDQANFKRMTGRAGRDEVLDAIRLARDLGLGPIKVNAVVIRGLNDHELEDLAEFARRERLVLRFIEFMPLDASRSWQKDLVVPGREILARLQQRFRLHSVPSDNPAETARRWRFENDDAEIGIIAPVSEPFCGHCNRIRLTADGQVRTCLFSVVEKDLKGLLRGGATDADLIRWLRGVAHEKEERHHIGEAGFEQPQRSMSCIGG
ncbi:MAG: GTP 3',8-cyclase MoaA [Verrucomicrobiales bacterium]|nr:GTP 3',8-cyclase MoaA [Verrucomicrobiales bacterium]